MKSAFETIEEMITSLPRNEQVLVNRLRAIVRECLPAAIENAYYDWRVPFYKRNRLICFIWPPSLELGKYKPTPAQIERGVSLGFCQGNRMSNEDGALLAEGRKQVYVLYIKSLKELDENLVRALLFEAAMVDEEFKKKKVKRPARKRTGR
ncbi:MAG TPA: DUF1801 domain-containing protein [Cyclobacteriaceae bacterium]|nr:DUF1801 domain-containing protein [Cyclobacteriaceae bacterium]